MFAIRIYQFWNRHLEGINLWLVVGTGCWIVGLFLGYAQVTYLLVFTLKFFLFPHGLLYFQLQLENGLLALLVC